MCVKNGMSIHDSSPTQYKGSHKVLWEKCLGAPIAISMS